MTDLFEFDGENLVLVGGYSATSRRYHFPRSPVCPYSGADDVTPVRLPREGRLWLWTSVTTAPPGYDGPVPYGFGVVELDGVGLRVIGRLVDADVDAHAEGEAMVVVADRFRDVETWAFAPAAAGRGSA